ncbi:hypothetical protein SBBP2_20091 [Burkholderiales bacterium]|nr:hypothetical protein SBBP2_20091 [Burkholderiales bacterium]
MEVESKRGYRARANDRSDCAGGAGAPRSSHRRFRRLLHGLRVRSVHLAFGQSPARGLCRCERQPPRRPSLRVLNRSAGAGPAEPDKPRSALTDLLQVTLRPQGAFQATGDGASPCRAHRPHRAPGCSTVAPAICGSAKWMRPPLGARPEQRPGGLRVLYGGDRARFKRPRLVRAYARAASRIGACGAGPWPR